MIEKFVHEYLSLCKRISTQMRNVKWKDEEHAMGKRL
jgi:hypothetical protein